MRSIRIVSLCAFLLAGSAKAQAIDPKAEDGVALFMAQCVLTHGTKDKALATIPESKFSIRLAEDRVRKLQGGRSGGTAWAIRSPRNAELLLEYDPRGTCGVRIAEAEEASVQKAFEDAIHKSSDAQKGKLVEAMSQVRVQDGIPLTFKDWILQVEGQKKANFGLTTAPRRVGAQQHLMTFSQ